MTATTIWELPCLSQEIHDGPELRWVPGGIVLEYNLGPSWGWEGMTFTGVTAFAFTYDGSCTVEQIDAYDVVQEVTGARWPTELSRMPDGCRHYRIYFDETGCYEFLAQAFVPPAEGPPADEQQPAESG